jgi:hypothetical protein
VTEENKTYSFKDIAGSIKLTELTFGKQPDDNREPVHVEFGYKDKDGKWWLVEATGTREPAVRLQDIVDVRVDLTPVPPTGTVEGVAHIVEVGGMGEWEPRYDEWEPPVPGAARWPPSVRQCTICNHTTVLACSDCKIDTGTTVYVCPHPECRRAHERTHKAKKDSL